MTVAIFLGMDDVDDGTVSSLGLIGAHFVVFTVNGDDVDGTVLVQCSRNSDESVASL